MTTPKLPRRILTYADKDALGRALHDALTRALSQHDSIKDKEDEMRDSIEEAMRLAVRLGEQETRAKLDEAIDDLTEKRLRRERAAALIDTALRRFWRPRFA
jgi:hypothetical protein